MAWSRDAGTVRRLDGFDADRDAWAIIGHVDQGQQQAENYGARIGYRFQRDRYQYTDFRWFVPTPGFRATGLLQKVE